MITQYTTDDTASRCSYWIIFTCCNQCIIRIAESCSRDTSKVLKSVGLVTRSCYVARHDVSLTAVSESRAAPIAIRITIIYAVFEPRYVKYEESDLKGVPKGTG